MFMVAKLQSDRIWIDTLGHVVLESVVSAVIPVLIQSHGNWADDLVYDEFVTQVHISLDHPSTR